MRFAASFASLVVVGSALFPQHAEGQYPFLDPDDPCFDCITNYIEVPIPANQNAAWSDTDLLGQFALDLSGMLDTFADAEVFSVEPGDGDSAEDLKAFVEELDETLECLPTLERLLDRINDRLDKLGVDAIVDASSRNQQRLSRADLIRQANAKLAEIQKKARAALKRIGE